MQLTIRHMCMCSFLVVVVSCYQYERRDKVPLSNNIVTAAAEAARAAYLESKSGLTVYSVHFASGDESSAVNVIAAIGAAAKKGAVLNVRVLQSTDIYIETVCCEQLYCQL